MFSQSPLYVFVGVLRHHRLTNLFDTTLKQCDIFLEKEARQIRVVQFICSLLLQPNQMTWVCWLGRTEIF